MNDFTQECTFAWTARVPIAPSRYQLLYNDIEALHRRLSRLVTGSQVVAREGVVDCEGPTSRVACATTWKILQAIEAFAGRHAVAPSEYRMTCNGTAAEHILGVARAGSPATRGDTLPQLRELFRDNIPPSSVPEVCRARCLYPEFRSTAPWPQTAAAKPTVRSSEKVLLAGAKGGRKSGLGSLFGPEVAQVAYRSVLLLLLVISYLFYYYMDVELEIVTLPRVEVMREAAWRKTLPLAPEGLPGANRDRGVLPRAPRSGA